MGKLKFRHHNISYRQDTLLYMMFMYFGFRVIQAFVNLGIILSGGSIQVVM